MIEKQLQHVYSPMFPIEDFTGALLRLELFLDKRQNKVNYITNGQSIYVRHRAAKRKPSHVVACIRAKDLIDTGRDDRRYRHRIVSNRWERRLAKTGQIRNQQAIALR